MSNFEFTARHTTLEQSGLSAVAVSYTPPPASRTAGFSGDMIVPTLRVVTQRMTLRVILDAERPGRHSHAERGNDQ